MKTDFIKKGFSALLSVVILVSACGVQRKVQAAEGQTAPSATYRFTAQASPGELVSFLLTPAEADYESLTENDIIKTDIIEADEKGSAVFYAALDDVQLDGEGKITNYKLKSNKDIDINSGVRLKDGFTVYIDGTETELAAAPVKENGIIYMPIQETFSKLGVEVKQSGGIYTGTGNNGDFEIVMGEDTVEIDWVDVEMPAASKSIDGVDMIPLYIFEDALKIDAPVVDEFGSIYLKKPEVLPEKETFDIEKVIEGKNSTTILSNFNSPTVYRASNAAGTLTANGTGALGSIIRTEPIEIKCQADTYGQCSGGQVYKNVSANTYTKGDVALLTFEARMTYTTDESGTAMPIVQLENSDWSKVMFERISIPGDWKKFYIPVYDENYSIDDAGGRLMFIIEEPMTVEIKNLSLVNYGTELSITDIQPDANAPYKGMEEDALWRKEAYRRIEKYRKGDMTVLVKDSNGNPVKNAEINVNMTDNEFMFGVALCQNEVLDLDEATAKGRIMRDLIDNSFNTGVCGMEMKRGDMLGDDGIDGIKMANEYFSLGKRMRGHAVFWDGVDLQYVDDYRDKTYQELYDEIMAALRPAVYAFRGKMAQWDVLNEPTDSNYLRVNYDTTRLYADVFKEVKRLDPDTKLFVNETGIEGQEIGPMSGRVTGLVKIVKELQREGAEIDGIGVQAHCVNFYYPQGFYRQLDTVSSVVDEIAVTEYDFLQNEHENADEHLRDTLLATFSHPKATAFVVWGVEDSMHWRNAAPFYDREWNERPAKAVWDNMVNEEFKTRATVYTDSSGRATIRGFYGDYDITCKAANASGSAKFKLAKNSENTAEFTVSGAGMTAEVSQSPEGNIAPVEYKNTNEAMEEYRENYEPEYAAVYLDTRFKGAENNTNVTTGVSSPASAEGWASPKADNMTGLIAGGDDIALYVKPTAAKTGEMHHSIAVKNRYEDTDLYTEIMFDTLSAAASGKAEIELSLDGENLGSIVYNSGAYSIRTADNTELQLDRDAQYSLKISALPQGGLKYVLTTPAGKVLTSHNANVTVNTSAVSEAVCSITSEAAIGENLFKLHNLRVGAEKDGEIIEFAPADYSTVLLDESMKDFAPDEAEYLGTAADTAAISGLAADKWGLYGPENRTDSFDYEYNGKYLFTMRNAPNSAEYGLVKKFEPAKNGEKLELSFDMYMNGAADHYNSTSIGTISIGNTDKTSCIDLVKFWQEGWYGGFKYSVLGKDGSYKLSNQGLRSGYVTTDNLRDLKAKLTLTPNTSGNYDASLRIWSNAGEVCSLSWDSIMTAAEIGNIEALYISAQTDAGDAYGKKLIGFKHIRLTRSGLELPEENGGRVYDNKSANLGVVYNNVTGWRRDAVIIGASYDNDRLVGVISRPCEITAGEGEMGIDISAVEADGADSYKIFLMDGLQSIVPYKAADLINIKKEQTAPQKTE